MKVHSPITQPFWHQGQFHGRQFFHGLGLEEWFGDDSSTLHLLCTLFLLLLHPLHLRSSGIRYQRLGTPALKNGLGVGRTFHEEGTARTEAQRQGDAFGEQQLFQPILGRKLTYRG